jgi:signal transduction histidine kinase
MAAPAALLGWVFALLLALAAAAVWGALRGQRERALTAAHELRAPITVIALALEAEATRPGTVAVHHRAIELELERARLALDDLHHGMCVRGLSAEKARSRAVFGHVDPVALLAECVDAALPLAAAAGSELSWAWEGTRGALWGDRARLRQALANLIANGLEHGGGPVRVIGRAAEGRVRIEVRDAGCGLPAPVTVLSARARAGGSCRGRGLAIATEIAAHHGGRIAAAPASTGARVVLVLPDMA